MIQGILQRLFIVEQDDCCLILRELPLMEWLLVGGLFLIGAELAIIGMLITAVGAVVIALLLLLQSRMRYITFDADSDMLIIHFQYPLWRRMANEYRLKDIGRAYVTVDDDDYTQIVVSATNGEEMALSVHSRDMSEWKETVVLAINSVLHEAHKDDAVDF